MKNSMHFQRYHPYPAVPLPDRSWPGKTISKAPVWCSVDLRDGNQALPNPMNITEKMEMFHLLLDIGFKEIEIGFPSASQVDFDFARHLIEEKHIPDDVTIQVLTPAREQLIHRTFDSLKGANRAIVHLYNSTSTIQRRVVFGKNRKGITRMATDAARLMMELRDEMESNHIRFEYSPESFTGTEMDYSLDICQAVMDVWKPTPGDKIIINLPATVEMSTPNVYADRIEWFLRQVNNRDSIIMSVHTHNDRGTAVAAAELAVMAGAERVEGALFGNGERTGNMDIVTMALNLFSQGIDPELDFSDIDRIREACSRCTRMDIHPRHPYAGDLVYTAFSGSHQDAINKGMQARTHSIDDLWDVPYLPIDPGDVGREYESIIRINSQSGKGGVAHVMERDWGLRIPKKMQPDFSRIIQGRTETVGRELSSQEVYECFVNRYLCEGTPYRLKNCSVQTKDHSHEQTVTRAVIDTGAQDIIVESEGNGPVEAFIHGISKELDIPIEVIMYEEHALTSGADARAIAYIGLSYSDNVTFFGAGIDTNISIASIKAVLCAVNRTATKTKTVILEV